MPTKVRVNLANPLELLELPGILIDQSEIAAPLSGL